VGGSGGGSQGPPTSSNGVGGVGVKAAATQKTFSTCNISGFLSPLHHSTDVTHEKWKKWHEARKMKSGFEYLFYFSLDFCCFFAREYVSPLHFSTDVTHEIFENSFCFFLQWKETRRMTVSFCFLMVSCCVFDYRLPFCIWI